MVAIPVIYAENKTDPRASLREFKGFAWWMGTKMKPLGFSFCLMSLKKPLAIGMSNNHQVLSLVGKF